MPKDLLKAVALCAVCTVLMPAAAAATLIVPADFSTMVAESQLIVHGRVVDVRSQMTAGRRTIESVVTVAVADALKGSAGGTIVFRVPNGQVGRYRRVMVGAPEFVEGDEVVLFLKGGGPTIPLPFGLSQGVYRVTRTRNGPAMVLPLVSETAGRVVRGDPARRPLSIDEFSRQVRAFAERRP